jgi:anti-sigma B factor antagonist
MATDDLSREGSLSVSVEADGDAVKLAARGEMDLATADVVDRELVKAEASDARRIILDLSGVEFIDSSGLKVLVHAARRSDSDSNRLAVMPGTGQVAEMLRLTGIEKLLTLV